ncbi:MAG: hypothetical protein AAFY02_20945 [Pseudomonadota bacterium]
MIEVPNRPDVVQLLARSLSILMATQRFRQKPWTKRRVADYITTSTEIEGTISATTLGRFLTPEYAQEPSDNTLRMVAEFLIKFDGLTSRQLELLEQAPQVQALGPLDSYFASSVSQARQDFLREFTGLYHALSVDLDLLLTVELSVTYVPEAEALSLVETLVLYRMLDARAVAAQTDDLNPTSIQGLGRLVKGGLLKEVGQAVTAGTALANSDIIALLHLVEHRGFPSIFNVTGLIVDDDEKIVGMRGQRNVGWRALARGEAFLPPGIDRDTPPRTAIKVLSQDLEYHRSRLGETQGIKPRPEGTGTVENGDQHHFLDDRQAKEAKDPFDLQFAQRVKEARTADERLLLALEWSQLEAFKQALAEGADPNLVPAGETEPLIFQLAHNGRVDWVTALLETGRCDLLVEGKDGMTASHAPGVFARRLARAGDAPEQAARFAALYNQLLQEEIRQLEARAAVPKSDT